MFLVGCSDKNSEEVIGLNEMLNEQMGVEILIPEYKGLDVYVAYVSFHDDGEPEEVSIQYSKNRGSLNEEYAKQMEEQWNVKVLYGPFDVDYDDVIVGFSSVKKEYALANVKGERIIVDDVEVVIQDKVDSNNFQHHQFVIDNHSYRISYQLNHFSEEEAFEQTKAFIEELNERIKDSKTEE